MNDTPTWSEGWQAHAGGWPLYEGHTAAYVAGWKAREALVSKLVDDALEDRPYEPDWDAGNGPADFRIDP
jgi:hypothetical protein